MLTCFVSSTLGCTVRLVELEGLAAAPADHAESLPAPSHELALCLLTAVAGLSSNTSAHSIIGAWADMRLLSAVAAYARVLPRSLWGDLETGTSAWRK